MVAVDEMDVDGGMYDLIVAFRPELSSLLGR